jgi:hypothetical protein
MAVVIINFGKLQYPNSVCLLQFPFPAHASAALHVFFGSPHVEAREMRGAKLSEQSTPPARIAGRESHRLRYVRPAFLGRVFGIL